MIHYTFVTQSKNKLAEAERILGANIESYSLELPEMQSIKVEDVVGFKAKYAYEALGGRPVMIEDTGLYFDAWNGLPGALVKWFVEQVGPGGICQMLQNFANRGAVAKTIVATFDGQLQIFAGEIRGTIATAPAGERGFGWDSLFIPQGATKTFGEMEPAEKDAYSMRRLALEAMRAHINHTNSV
jgi:non-canonical purine NTP pyrophosphatase (RdgB/HAM1 family)